jgi:MFS family permease
MYLLVNVLFGLGNSSDAFLILRSQTLGYDASDLVLLYVVFNATYAVLSYPFGRVFDRFGARWVLALSFFVFAFVYAGFALASHAVLLWGLWILYGVYMAMSEGVGKAYISTLVGKETRATALGLFATVTGVVTFFSSVTAGVLWQSAGVAAPFVFAAVLAALAGGVFLSSSGVAERPVPFHRN